MDDLGHPLDIAAQAWWLRACRVLASRRTRSQREVGPMLGMSQGGFGQYELGQRIPRMRAAIAWAGLLDCRLGMFRGAGAARQLITVREWVPAAGQNMRALREQAGLFQRGLRDRTGLALATVQGLEAARHVAVDTWAHYVFGIGWAPVLLGPDGEPACHTPRMSTNEDDGRGLVRRLYGDSEGRWLLATGSHQEGLPERLGGLAPLGAPAQVIKKVYDRGKGLPGRLPVQAALAHLLGMRQQNVSYALVRGIDPDLAADAWATLVRLYYDRDLWEAALRDARRRESPPG